MKSSEMVKKILATLLVAIFLGGCLSNKVDERNYGIVIDISERIDGCNVTIEFNPSTSEDNVMIATNCADYKVGDTIFLFNSRTDTIALPFKN